MPEENGPQGLKEASFMRLYELVSLQYGRYEQTVH
jgi:hypothetical protein